MKIFKFLLAIGFLGLIMTIATKLGEIITIDNIMFGLKLAMVIAIIGIIKINIEEWRSLKNGQVR